MAYKQKHTKSSFPFKSPLKDSSGDAFAAGFDEMFNATKKANKIKNSAENSKVSETQKVNGLDCPTFGGGPRKYDKNGLVIK